jgi:hypothetical protein
VLHEVVGRDLVIPIRHLVTHLGHDLLEEGGQDGLLLHDEGVERLVELLGADTDDAQDVAGDDEGVYSRVHLDDHKDPPLREDHVSPVIVLLCRHADSLARRGVSRAEELREPVHARAARRAEARNVHRELANDALRAHTLQLGQEVVPPAAGLGLRDGLAEVDDVLLPAAVPRAVGRVASGTGTAPVGRVASGTGTAPVGRVASGTAPGPGLQLLLQQLLLLLALLELLLALLLVELLLALLALLVPDRRGRGRRRNLRRHHLRTGRRDRCVRVGQRAATHRRHGHGGRYLECASGARRCGRLRRLCGGRWHDEDAVGVTLQDRVRVIAPPEDLLLLLRRRLGLCGFCGRHLISMSSIIYNCPALFYRRFFYSIYIYDNNINKRCQ